MINGMASPSVHTGYGEKMMRSIKEVNVASGLRVIYVQAAAHWKYGKMTASILIGKTMKLSFLAGLAAMAFVSNAAMAADGADLAKAKNCLACHSVSNKVVGPAYKDVAAKYAGQKDAEEKLVKKVMKGGSGVWGSAAMPPNTQVTEAEAHILVKWVLSLK
jgi:cytochrome c